MRLGPERAGDLPRPPSWDVTCHPATGSSKVHALSPGSLMGFQGKCAFLTSSGVGETQGERPTLGTKGTLLTL